MFLPLRSPPTQPLSITHHAVRDWPEEPDLWHSSPTGDLVIRSSQSRETFRFDDFELDVTAYELRRQGRRVRLERRPMDLLIMMVERRGELITRSEIVEHLWGPDVFIEVETAVNTLVRKIRQALRDASDAPTFVETVPGKGYRFIAPIEVVADSRPPLVPVDGPSQKTNNRRRPMTMAIAALLLVAAIGAWAWKATRPNEAHVRLAVLPFEHINVESGREYLADALHEETIVALGQVDPEHIEVLARTSMLQYRQTQKSLAQIAKELDVAYLVESSIHTENGRIPLRRS